MVPFRIAAFLAPWLVAGCAALPNPHAMPATAPRAAVGPSVYDPYRFLVGEWHVGPEKGPPLLVARIRFGPGESYLWYAASTLQGGTEYPHFEGMLVWNGTRRHLDMLLSLDLSRGLVQEAGAVRALPDGRVVRDIVAHYSPGVPLPPRGEAKAGPDGASIAFRQVFTPVNAARVLTTLERRESEQWVPAFPGSDALVMTRSRPAGNTP